MKELKEEGGVTQISLQNIRLLAVLHGPVRFLVHYAPAGSSVEDETIFLFQDGFRYAANGFSSGYAGEGPRGLHDIIHEALDRNDITMEHIAGWRGGGYWVLRGQGSGKEIYALEEMTIFGRKFAAVEVW